MGATAVQRPTLPVNILLVDDQPAKLLSYEVILGELGENLIRASSGKEALELLLKKDVAVILMDVCMPELDGFELASMIRRHPRFQKTAIIHVSAVNLTDIDRLRGYDSGAADYVSVPVVPEVLRAKVKVFADLYRKTEELERLNRQLEQHVSERTQELVVSTEQLGKSEERFRFMAETIPSFVWTTAPDGAITYVNQRWLTYCGLAPDATPAGWSEGAAVHPEDDERSRTRWAEALREGTQYENEVRLRRHDGVYRWFLTRGVPQRNAHGHVIGWFGVTTDIHDQKVMSEQLREADRRKDDFLAMLAHELRNPLAAIRSALEVVRHPGRSTADGRWGHDVIDRQTKHLTRMIDDLLDVNRIAHDKLELRREPVDLREILTGALESCRTVIDQRGLELAFAVPAQPVFVDADQVRLSQVFLNLLDNAAKFTPRGGSVRLSVEQSGREALVRVADTGSGIAPEALPRLFELFYQANESLERSHGGLGIGLTLARRLVRLHGGTIEATSAGVGKGSEFIVALPSTEAPLPEGDAAGSAKAIAPPLRILVVDDNEDSAESLGLLLRLAGHEVVTAHDGEEALVEADRFRPSVALLDIGMPRMNGYDVARKLREQPWGKTMLLVAETGWAQEEDRRRTREAGFDAHLVKPVDPAALIKLLAAFRPDTGAA